MHYLIWTLDSYCERGKYFCSTNCESLWLDEHMKNIEQGRPIEFIRHRRESQGYEKVTETVNRWLEWSDLQIILLRGLTIGPN
jgi:hypothetical protein